MQSTLAVARVAEQSPGAAWAVANEADAIAIPLGLVALCWVRAYLPLVRLGLPQAPKNNGPDGPGFAKAGFRRLLGDGIDPTELGIGAVFKARRAEAVFSAIGEAANTIASIPANFTRYPNSDNRVFEVVSTRRRKSAGVEIDLARLGAWGTLVVPGHLWRALCRFGAWVEPMLIAEWSRLTCDYAERSGIAISPGLAEAAMVWRVPVRS